MIKTTASVLTLFTVSALTAQEHQHIEWYADFDVAAAAAKKEGKDLLVDFTGSDWCGWCIKLHEEVFSHEEFETGVASHYVLVALDYPRSKEAKDKVPNPERNKELQAKYEIQGFPTVLAMTPDGDVFGKTGYQAGGPKPYVEAVVKMRTEGKKNLATIRELVAKFDAAEGAERTKMVAMAVDALATMSAEQMEIEKLAPIALEATKGSDKALAEKAIVALVKGGQADAECLAKAEALDPDNAKGLLDHVTFGAMRSVQDDASAKAFLAKLDNLVAKGAKDADLFEMMIAQAAGWSAGPLKDMDAAKKYATILKEKAKDVTKHERLLKHVFGEGDGEGNGK